MQTTYLQYKDECSVVMINCSQQITRLHHITTYAASRFMKQTI